MKEKSHKKLNYSKINAQKLNQREIYNQSSSDLTINREKTNYETSTDNKINCAVIRDLLPSYIDNICSEDSKKIIEQHFFTCPDCVELAKALKESEIAEGEREAKQIAYMKKIKKHIGIKEFIGLSILLGMIGISLSIFSNWYGVIPEIYFILLPLILLDTHFLLSDHIVKNRKTEPKTILTIASGLLLCAGILLAFISMQWVERENYPFGLTAAELGGFLNTIYVFLTLCELGIFVTGIILTLKTANSHSIVISISMTGLFLMFYIHSVFTTLSSIEHSIKALHQSLYLLLDGGCIAGLTMLFEKRRLREK